MGKLTLTLRAGPDTSRDRGRILTRLRSRGARLVGSHVTGTAHTPTEVFEFTTTAAQRRKAPTRGRLLIASSALQQQRLVRLESIARMATAFGWQLHPTNSAKEQRMRNVSARTLVLCRHASEARKLYELAKRLVRGEGPPDELRMPSPPVSIVPCGEERARDAWGIGGVGVAIEMRRPYPPIEALVVAGYILFGLDWPARFKALRLPAALETAYRALEQHFEGSATPTRPEPVTIPKALPRRTSRPPSTPVLTDHRTDAALPPPIRPQLTRAASTRTITTPTEGEES